MNAALSIAIALATVALCTTIHYETVGLLDRRLRARSGSLRRHVPAVVVCVIAVHLLEVLLFAFAFWLVATRLDAGAFASATPSSPRDFVALAAESYTSFGYGDIVPSGWLRFVVSLAPINGLLLIAWSGAFLYGAVHQRPADSG